MAPDLAGAARRLKQLVAERLGWQFDVRGLGGLGGAVLLGDDEEDDEDGPVLVEDPTDLVRL